MAVKAVIFALVVVFLVYLVGTLTEEQVETHIADDVSRAERQIEAIARAARDYYRVGVTTRDGRDPWSLEFQFERVEELWPDLFSIVDDPLTQPIDPFDPEDGTYFVATQGNTMLLISLGPNRKLDVSPGEIQESFEDDSFLEKIQTDWAYSPSNGTRSPGDLFHHAQYLSEVRAP